MKMKVFLIVLCLTSTAMAQGLDVSGLNDKQKAELALKVAEMQETQSDITSIESVQKYAEVGQSIAVAIGSCAKELGVAVDDFSKTPVGRLTTALIVWKVIGKDIVHITLGSFILVVGISIWCYQFRKMRTDRIVYDENGKKKQIIYKDLDGEIQFVMLICVILIVSASCAIILTG
jgi:hypothetical protein